MDTSKRAFLQGRNAPGDDVHISSLVVHCRPEVLLEVKDRITAMPDADVPEYAEEGKLVVLLETTSEARIMQRISEIEHLPGVINAALVYHQIDSDTGNTP